MFLATLQFLIIFLSSNVLASSPIPGAPIEPPTKREIVSENSVLAGNKQGVETVTAPGPISTVTAPGPISTVTAPGPISTVTAPAASSTSTKNSTTTSTSTKNSTTTSTSTKTVTTTSTSAKAKSTTAPPIKIVTTTVAAAAKAEPTAAPVVQTVQAPAPVVQTVQAPAPVVQTVPAPAVKTVPASSVSMRPLSSSAFNASYKTTITAPAKSSSSTSNAESVPLCVKCYGEAAIERTPDCMKCSCKCENGMQSQIETSNKACPKKCSNVPCSCLEPDGSLNVDGTYNKREVLPENPQIYTSPGI